MQYQILRDGVYNCGVITTRIFSSDAHFDSTAVLALDAFDRTEIRLAWETGNFIDVDPSLSFHAVKNYAGTSQSINQECYRPL
jgi:hypothetical protein